MVSPPKKNPPRKNAAVERQAEGGSFKASLTTTSSRAVPRHVGRPRAATKLPGLGLGVEAWGDGRATGRWKLPYVGGWDDPTF